MRQRESKKLGRAQSWASAASALSVCAGLGALACSSDNGAENALPPATGPGASADNQAGGGGTQTGTDSDGGAFLIDGTPGGDATMEACATSTSKASLLPTYLQFVIDISGSMNCRPTDPVDQGCMPGPGSKWSLTRAALGSVIAQMPSTLSAGAILYPDADIWDFSPLCFSGKASVPMAELSDAQKNVFGQVLNGTDAFGATPTEDAYLFAMQSFGGIPDESNKLIVLVTDGYPSVAKGCTGDGKSAAPTEPLVKAAADALTQGIKTFVVGSPGSETVRSALSQMASQGGTAMPGCSDNGPNYCHLDMTTQADFGQAITDALSAVAGKALACSFEVPAPGDGSEIDLNLVNVIYAPGAGAPEVIGQNSQSPCTGDGWHYSDDRTQIILCDETCTAVKANPEAAITIEFGCGTKQIK
jgi:hypothetical protein